MSDKHVFTIPPSLCFADTLTEFLLKTYSPVELARVLLLLPTRRACRTVRESFLNVADGKPMLLPRMIPFGMIDSDETATELLVKGSEALPPALPALRRRLLLTQQIRTKDETVGMEKALQLADSLAAFLDESHIERFDLSLLTKIVPEEYAEHWQKTLEFLDILIQRWPSVLRDEGAIDAADRQVRLFTAQAELWRKTPPDFPVIAAGSTGSQPATADLLDAVASLPNGMVILPGLDTVTDDESFAAIEKDPSHPQYHLFRLLQRMELTRADVRPLTENADPDERFRLISEAMRPAATTDKWQNLPKFSDTVLDGVSRMDCADRREEAVAIALILREAIETKGKTAALVTPDRDLARRVIAEMKRWGVVMDDSAGMPLARTELGTYLILLGEATLTNVAPYELLACLKHPLAQGGGPYGLFRERVRRLEKDILRGSRTGDGWDGLDAAAQKADAGREEYFVPLIRRLSEILRPLTDMMADPLPKDFSVLLDAHLKAAEGLAETTEKSGADRLWREEAGEAAVALFRDIRDNADLIGKTTPRGYMTLLTSLMRAYSVRPKYGMHSRLDILGTMEARMLRPDVLVLGGLNEGVWPKTPSPDPWISRPMRNECDIPMPERKIALSAHDFCQAFCAPTVILSRSLKDGGTPTVPSRWLSRLDAVLSASKRSWTPAPYVGYARKIDMPEEIVNIRPPAPKPPVESRPRKLAVTQVETLFRDPYSVYARFILGLKPLDDIDKETGLADIGIALHAAVQEFCEKYPAAVPDDAEDIILTIGRKAVTTLNFSATAAAFWKPRVDAALLSFLTERRERESERKYSYCEQEGAMTVDTQSGPFTLIGKADRIDKMADDTLTVVDYKTGSPPSQKEVKAGYSPQLPLEAIMAENGAFPDIPAATVTRLEYRKLREDGFTRLLNGSASELAQAALDRLKTAVDAYDDPTIPYLPSPDPSFTKKYRDYDDIARFDEWATRDDETENDNG